MNEKYWTLTEIMEIFEVNGNFIERLEEEEIVCPVCREGSPAKLFSESDLEKLRFAKILMEELDVNLQGVEVILQMRQNMVTMRRQFDDILEELSKHLKEHLA